MEFVSISAETIVEPNQKKYPWYHQSFRRVPTIDQCYTDDQTCVFEANQQFRRDKMVENEILSILRQRFEDCMLYEAPDHVEKCTSILRTYEKAAENWFTKCKRKFIKTFHNSLIYINVCIFFADGDLGGYGDAKTAYMKQKHRMIWERRHGPVGSGMKEEN